jgi:hypothetical protein
MAGPTYHKLTLECSSVSAGTQIAIHPNTSRMSTRPRVIVALPDIAECATVAEWLVADGFEPVRRPNPRSAAEEMRVRAFDLLVADATMAMRDELLAASRGRNPLTPPVVIGNATMAGSRVGATMCLERPVGRAVLVCTVTMAIMDGRPTRRSARKLANRFEAIADGVPCHIVDVSTEGLRLEIPRQRLSVPPPYFNVCLPLVGIAVTVQRRWARSSPGQGPLPVTWCGGALTANRPGVEQRWRVFVDMIPTLGGTPSI